MQMFLWLTLHIKFTLIKSRIQIHPNYSTIPHKIDGIFLRFQQGKVELDYYDQKLNVQGATRVAERRKT